MIDTKHIMPNLNKANSFGVMLFMIDTKPQMKISTTSAMFWSNVIHNRYKTSNCLAITL